MKIPFFSFDYVNSVVKKNYLESFSNFIDTQEYILGGNVLEFEEKYATFSTTAYCIGVSNGYDALFLALKSLSIKQGDEVIVPSNTFIATVLSIIRIGAVPIFVEPDLFTYNINPNLIEEKINSKTKAIIAVHLYGRPCEMDLILDIAKKNNLYIIEDNAQSQGAMYKGKKTGSFGDINAVSFYPTKNLGALGDAGAITTNSESLRTKVKTLRNYGSRKKYQNSAIGYNHRLDEFQAMILLQNLKHLHKWNNLRHNISTKYNENLKGISNLELPNQPQNSTHVYHQYVVRLQKRNELQAFLNNAGVQTIIHYPIPPHLQACFKYLGYNKGDFPLAEKISSTCLSLPIYPGLSDGHIEFICKKIHDFYG